MNAGCVQMNEALNNLVKFLCLGMKRKHLTEVLELRGYQTGMKDFQQQSLRTNDPDLCDL